MRKWPRERDTAELSEIKNTGEREREEALTLVGVVRVLRLSGGIRQEQDSLWWKLAGCCSAVSSVPARSGPALLRRIAQPPPAVQHNKRCENVYNKNP